MKETLITNAKLIDPSENLNDIYDILIKNRKIETISKNINKNNISNVIDAKGKKLHQVYKGLSAAVVKEAFGWDDNFMLPDPDTYPQASRSASGLVMDA